MKLSFLFVFNQPKMNIVIPIKAKPKGGPAQKPNKIAFIISPLYAFSCAINLSESSFIFSNF